MKTYYDIFDLGDYVLQSRTVLHDAKIAFAIHGTLDDTRSNAIVFPTCYAGNHLDNRWLIGEGKPLDTSRYFVIVPDMLGNGISSSPSNTPPPQARADFPNVTVYDNVAMQHRLLTERFDIQHLQLAIGFSMGAQQSFQWAVSYPQFVERIVALCGTARTSNHNWVFLEGAQAALRADAGWQEGNYEHLPERGLRAMGRVWAGWGLSQEFYRKATYLRYGYRSLEDFLVRKWEEPFLNQDANNLLAMAWTWQNADISLTPGFDGDIERALKSIEARALLMPGSTDLYFPPEDNAYEAQHIPGAELRTIPSIWGHAAGTGPTRADAAFIEENVREWLAR